jgi:quercetin dioxygenase-like cupin family protein
VKITTWHRTSIVALALLPLTACGAGGTEANTSAPPEGTSVVETEGLTANIKFESVLAGPLTELNGRYKLRVTELVLAAGGQVGAHHHAGPGIRQVTDGVMTYVLPEETRLYGPGDFFFESGDVTHTAQNKTNAPMTHILFEILPADHRGPSIRPAR